MLLQRLKAYADERMEIPPTLYSEAPVRYVIELDETGRLLSPEPIDTADPANAETRRGQRQTVPRTQRTVAIKPLLLADNAEYTLGLARPEAKPARVEAAHRAYREMVERCAQETGEPAVQAVVRFLEAEPLRALRLPAELDAGATVTFRVDGVFPTDLPSVQAFWAAINDPDHDPAHPAPVMQCLVCGEERPVLTRLKAKIKGVPGGQTSGTALISANADAFTSYGLKASLIAPTCAPCGERFTLALNELLSRDEHHIVTGGAAFVFWTREKVDFSFRGAVVEADPEEVRRLIDSVRSGRRNAAIDDTAFYAVALAGSGGRAAVRDWIDTTVGGVKEHVVAWFDRQAIVGSFGEEPQPLGIYALAGSTVRDLKDLTPTTPRALLRAAITGTPVPYDLLYEAVRRSRAEQSVTRQRAALIKLVLRSHAPDEEDTLIQLNPDHPSPAYHCGRLLAELEAAQRLAVRGIKATIVDRFYGTASSAPASVFPRLLRGARPHLSKLERDHPGAYHRLEERLEEIQARLAGFPRTLSLQDQGLFALGYYHQRAFDRAQARAATERRRGETALAGAGAPADGPEPDEHRNEADGFTGHEEV